MQEAFMQSKTKLLVPLLVILLAVLALTFTLYKPVQTGGGPEEPVPKLWGYVTYGKWCSPTDHDTVWLENGITEYTLVYQDGSDYKYLFWPPQGPAGNRDLYGTRRPDPCFTRTYHIYWDLEDLQQDIKFQQLP